MARHHCLSCTEPFERPEFFAFMLRLRSKTVNCMRCQTDNFIIPQKNISYVVFILASLLFGFVIFLLPNIAFAMDTYSEFDGSFKIGLLPLIAGGVLGLAAARLLMNILNWIFGSVSQDRKYKSAADFE